jgi:hypothetical protein
LDLLPKKFRDKYERENDLFKKLMTERTSKKNYENCHLRYFSGKLKALKAYSMLRTMLGKIHIRNEF